MSVHSDNRLVPSTVAAVRRLQASYLDVTPPHRDQGGFVAWMGDAEDAVKASASRIADGDDAEGFAHGGERFILP